MFIPSINSFEHNLVRSCKQSSLLKSSNITDLTKSTGILVKSETTSKDTIHLSSSSFKPVIVSTNS